MKYGWFFGHGNTGRRYRPYPQLGRKKMVQIVWVVCTGNLWRELHFEMLTMKHAGFDSIETY